MGSKFICTTARAKHVGVQERRINEEETETAGDAKRYLLKGRHCDVSQVGWGMIRQ